jgi:type I restriction enzyme M protein
VSLYGQEINQLSSAIGRMNLFLHGIEDFEIANDDTLTHPAYLTAGELRTFDMVLANPPYSISQWNREAFASDPFGRNIWGTPPQGRADYAFIQHIAKSLDPKTGRCAILLPHGILFRKEERDMREKMVRSDIVEAVIGLGANLFFNSPMEACVLVCRTRKPSSRVGRVLLIDASAEVTRRNAQSFLEDGHIAKIADTYASDEPVEGFSAYATIDEIAAKDYSLSIPIYVRSEANVITGGDAPSLPEAIGAWEAARHARAEAFGEVRDYLIENGGDPRENR